MVWVLGVWCVVWVGGWVVVQTLCMMTRWQNTWESDSRRPRHLGLNVQEDGGRKMPQYCGENAPPQTLNTMSMSWAEAPPGTGGNVSLQEHSDIYNHAETATTAPPHFSAQCDPCAPVVHNNGHGNNHRELSLWSFRTKMPSISGLTTTEGTAQTASQPANHP